jgi:hypothetical protein
MLLQKSAVEWLHHAANRHAVHGRIKAQSVHGLLVHHILSFHYCIALGLRDLELDELSLTTLHACVDSRKLEKDLESIDIAIDAQV